jgi:cell division protein FtsL
MSPVPLPARLPAAAPGRPRCQLPGPQPERLRPSGERPPLRLVDNFRLEQATRRRRARRLGVAAAVLAVASLMALAGTHAMLVSNQVRLDALERQAAEAQAHHQALRLEVATLEDPARVVSVATERLGMVAPEVITYLPPVARDREEGSRPPARAPEIASAALPWGAVKPYLGSL